MLKDAGNDFFVSQEQISWFVHWGFTAFSARK